MGGYVQIRFINAALKEIENKNKDNKSKVGKKKKIVSNTFKLSKVQFSQIERIII